MRPSEPGHSGVLRISVEPSAGALGEKAMELIGRQVGARSSVRVEASADADLVFAVASDLQPESYRIDGSAGGPQWVEGGDGRGVIYGAGRWLREAQFRDGCVLPGVWRGTSVPRNPIRGMYFATHFHNYYHNAPVAEVQRYVEELALYGCNCLSVWFDLHHFAGIDDPDAQEMIRRLRDILEAANAAGMGASLTLLANEGFTTTPDALKATNAAQNGYFRPPGGFYNTEICPSQPGGLDLILRNRHEVLSAFAGIEFDAIWIWPYDQGACTCADCAPWGANGFLRTAEPVAEAIQEHFPTSRVILSTWYFDRFIEGEWAAFHRWVDRVKPSWFDILMIDGYQGFPTYPLEHGVPGAFPVVGFPEISMEGNGPWGGYGANPRPDHWAKYWADCRHLQTGSFPYSEGFYEDINKFLMLQLNWQPDREVDSILKEYASAWFGSEFAGELVTVFHLMEADEGTRFAGVNETAQTRDAAPEFRNAGGLPHAEECEEIVAAIDRQLPEAVRASWRWRLIRLRARIDAELKRTDLRFSHALDDAFLELADMYHATPDATRGCVLPPRRP